MVAWLRPGVGQITTSLLIALSLMAIWSGSNPIVANGINDGLLPPTLWSESPLNHGVVVNHLGREVLNAGWLTMRFSSGLRYLWSCLITGLVLTFLWLRWLGLGLGLLIGSKLGCNFLVESFGFFDKLVVASRTLDVAIGLSLVQICHCTEIGIALIAVVRALSHSNTLRAALHAEICVCS